MTATATKSRRPDLDAFDDYARKVFDEDETYALMKVQVYALRWQELSDLAPTSTVERNLIESKIGEALRLSFNVGMNSGMGDKYDHAKRCFSRQCDLIGRTLVQWAYDATRAEAVDCIERVTNTEEWRDGE